MPETRLERAVFILGILAITALGLLIAHLWRNTHGVTAPPPSVSAPATTPTSTQHETTSPDTTATHPTGRARATTSTNATTTLLNPLPAKTTPTAVGIVALLVTAKTDTWLEIRSVSSTGPLLYSGTLAAATTKTFRAKTLWARFAAAGNLSARLNGKTIRLPSGTYDATFDGHGFRQVGT